MVKERQKDGVAYKNIALSRITLSNSLEAAIANGKEEEADFCREQLAKVRSWDRELLTRLRFVFGFCGGFSVKLQMGFEGVAGGG